MLRLLRWSKLCAATFPIRWKLLLNSSLTRRSRFTPKSPDISRSSTWIGALTSRTARALADLEIPELQQQLQEDQATIHRNESELDRAHEELNRANSAYKVAHLTYSRLADVQKSQPGLIAQQDIDVSEGKDVEANAGVSAAKDALASAEQAVAASKATLDKDKALYSYSHIVAPFEGVVTRLYAYKGALLPGGTSSNISGALPPIAKQSSSVGDPRTRKSRARSSPG